MATDHSVLEAIGDGFERELARLAGGLGLAVLLAAILAFALPMALVSTLPRALLGALPTSGVPPIAPPFALPPAAPESAASVARRYLGVPYLFGGTNPSIGLDCSGLVQLVYRQLGQSLPRTAQQQYDATQRLTPDQLQPGDLVFFARTYADPHDWITHVGIYVGGGQQINAPTTGQVVSIQPVFSGFWGAHLAAGGRIRMAHSPGAPRD